MKKKSQQHRQRRPARRQSSSGLRSAESTPRQPGPSPAGAVYVLRLFVTGTSPRSSAAVATIRSICDEHLAGNYELEVIDLYQDPDSAVGEQIVAAPTLIKKKPEPVRRMIGTLADRERVLSGLAITSGSQHPPAAASNSRR